MEESSNKPPSAAANPPSLQRMVTPENATAVVLFLETSKRSLSSEEVVVSSDSLDSRSNKKSRGRCEDPTTAASSEALKKLDRACPCPLTFPSTTTTTTTTADPLFAPHKRSKDLVEVSPFYSNGLPVLRSYDPVNPWPMVPFIYLIPLALTKFFFESNQSNA